MVFKILRNFARGVLDDDTSSPIVQIEFLKDFLSKHKYVYSQDFEENLNILKRKHLVDSFLVTNLDGSIVVSSEGNGHTDGIMGTAMLSYIKSELPDSESVLIKRSDGWFMLFSLNKKVFIVKAGSELSNIELKALSIELESLLNVNKNSGDKKKLTQTQVA
ncbi:MAG: hypothetical protein BWY55_00321 [archaeon ADurb.Bin336]|jgi:hypothetical protein|nr:MAG: hypothetical protein BWY55_00321 [archaeon ADurb.Bin336]